MSTSIGGGGSELHWRKRQSDCADAPTKSMSISRRKDDDERGEPVGFDRDL